MKTQYIEEAAKAIPNKQQLINMVSKRIRELSAGSRPMVEVNLQMGLADTALAEIARASSPWRFLLWLKCRFEDEVMTQFRSRSLIPLRFMPCRLYRHQQEGAARLSDP